MHLYCYVASVAETVLLILDLQLLSLLTSAGDWSHPLRNPSA